MTKADLTFESLVNAYSADLYRYAHWLVREPALAEDLVQETFMRAWKALHKLENPEFAKAWLFTILRREVARHLGKNKPDMVQIDGYDELDKWVDSDHFFGKVEHWALQQAMKDVPEKYLEPLLLQVIGGYSCEEIAGILNIKSGAVMTRVCRARQQLRHALMYDDIKQVVK